MPSRLTRAVAASVAVLVAASTLSIVPALARTDGRPPSGAETARVVPPKRATTAGERLDPALEAVAAAKTATGVHALAERSGVPLVGASVSVLVQAEAGSRASAEKAVADAGGTITGRAGDIMRVTVRPSALVRLAASPGVLTVKRTERPRKLAYASEGVKITNADRLQALGNDGSGAKVGIIDVGFYEYENLISLGYLQSIPASHTAVFDKTPFGLALDGSMNNPAGGRTDPEPHGAAVAETVHDMAPGAELYIAAIGDSIDLADAVDWMHAQGVTVISMSLGWIGSPLDGGSTLGADNTVNAAVSKAVNTYHMFWSNAAGNFRLNHWRGDFYDKEGDGALNWDGGSVNYNEFQYNGVDPIEGILWWKDSWTNAVNDYDLVLFQFDPSLRGGRGDWVSVNVGGQGEAIQWGRSGDQPFEDIYVPGRQLAPGWYAWAIVNMRPAPQAAVAGQHGYLPANNKRVDFDFFSPDQDLAIDRPYRSIMTPADNQSSGFMAVAAICSQWDAGGYLNRPGFGIQEYYSSEGPNQNGFVTPEISAPDDTTNYIASTVYGGTFRGTSASGPHLAGAAALVQAANPAWQGPQIEDYLKANALGLADPGFDRKTGAGALTLPATRTVDTRRLYGTSRYQTALAISGTWATGSAHSVVLASGANFADALAGGSLAGALGCPIELTPPSGATADLLAEMHRVTAGTAKPTVYILGSEVAVSRTVANQLAASGFAVTRFNGVNRYDTAARIAVASSSLRATDTAFIVFGGGYPDALAAAPISYHQGVPVLPVLTGSIPGQIESVITGLRIKHAIIVGSTSVVGTAVQNRLPALGVTTVERWYGATRYDTMRDVVEHASSAGYASFGHVGIASGANFPDALSGAAEAGHDGGVVLLTPPTILGQQAANEIGNNASAISTVSVYGGEPALQGAVVLGARVKSDH